MSRETMAPEEILADPFADPIHKMYARINIGIRDRGERWSKCANCGRPYQLTASWGIEDVCSKNCSEEYIQYLASERY